jgi:hypothetical protein
VIRMLEPRRLLATSLALAGLSLAACGSSSSPHIPVSGRLVQIPGSSTGRIVLTPLGAQRLGLQTGTVQSVPAPHRDGPTVVVPYSSLIYDPSGNTYLFTSLSSLTFAELPITVDHISGGSVYLVKGPPPGTRVVTIGAEELLGVQTGVLGQT